MPTLLRILGAAAALATTFVVFTWPLLRHPTTTVLDAVSLYGPAASLVQRDINLTIWVLAWDSHALLTDPLHLFHANAFWPAPYTLALSEHMLGNVPLFAPVYLLTGNPVLAHQFALVASFVLSGLAMAAWVWFWTRDATAALATGFLYAFAPFRFWQLGNLHVVSIQYLPLVMLGIDLALGTRRRVAGACLLTAALVLSTGCSYYVGYAAFALAGVYLPCAMLAHGRGALGRLPILLAALAVAGGTLAALSIPYVLLQHADVIADYTKEAIPSLAFLNAMMAGPTRLLTRYVWPDGSSIPVFLGVVQLLLAVVGIARWRRAPRAALLVVAATGVVLSLGPYLAWGETRIPLPYRWLSAIVPGFSAMRVPQRFASLVTLATVALAGLGLARMCAALQTTRPRAAMALPWAAVAVALLSLRPGHTYPTGMQVGAAVPGAYRWLAEHGDGGPLLEVPSAAHQLQRESQAMYFSTMHWLPLANGYTPYPPRSYTTLMEAVARLPDPAALADIRAQQPGLRWLLVDAELIRDNRQAEWTAMLDASDLRRVGTFDHMTLFEIPRP